MLLRPAILRLPRADTTWARPLNEQGPVPVIIKDVCFIDPANHYMVQGTGNVQAGLTWHGVTLSEVFQAVKYYAIQDAMSPMEVAARNVGELQLEGPGIVHRNRGGQRMKARLFLQRISQRVSAS
jgi:hypothetical protein